MCLETKFERQLHGTGSGNGPKLHETLVCTTVCGRNFFPKSLPRWGVTFELVESRQVHRSPVVVEDRMSVITCSECEL